MQRPLRAPGQPSLEGGEQRLESDAHGQLVFERLRGLAVGPCERRDQRATLIMQSSELIRREYRRSIDESRTRSKRLGLILRERVGLGERKLQRDERGRRPEHPLKPLLDPHIAFVEHDQLLLAAEGTVHRASRHFSFPRHVLDGHRVEAVPLEEPQCRGLDDSQRSAPVLVTEGHALILRLTTVLVNVTVTVMSHVTSDRWTRTNSGGTMTSRVPGLDVARAIAMTCMVVVNYEIALGASGTGPAWLGALTAALQGRAAAVFVVLAGVGVSLGAARAWRDGDTDARRAFRRGVLRRGLALFVLGLAFLAVWPADILHFYGAYFAFGAALVFAQSRLLWAVIVATVFAGSTFLASGAWPERWDFATLSYRDFWTPIGFVRNLVLDGWHPVLPWFALFVYGLWLGRAPLAETAWRRRAGMTGLALAIALWLLGRALAPLGVETEGFAALLAPSCFPPTPTYIGLGAALATAVIAASAELAARGPRRLVNALEAMGRLALTYYIGHVVVGLGVLTAIGRGERQSLPFAVLAALVFAVLAAWFSLLWTKRFARGPLEWLLRRITGGDA